jgi:2-hydroxychromene-2-carboxylate isomerase
MSIQSLLMPTLSQYLLGRGRLLKRRARAERDRLAGGERHQLHYFHQVDDPYSALVAAMLPDFMARYDVDLMPHVVGPPPDSAAPDRDKLVAYSRRDAQMLARHLGLNFEDPGQQPSASAVRRVTGLLVASVSAQRFSTWVGPLSAALWQGDEALGKLVASDPALQPAASDLVAVHLLASARLRQQWGHYLGGMFFYAGEWYWGLDRLHHLEQRLRGLGVQRSGSKALMFPPHADLAEAVAVRNPTPIDFFFSLRSPYSAIVAQRVFRLGQLTGAEVRLRFVLPMVMRGLPVPREKRLYIVLDAAREAYGRHIPFGRVNDPVGRPTERGLALIPYAERLGKGQAYVLSFLHGVWAEGIHAGSDRGLRKIVQRAGLPWDDARRALKDEAWRATAEQNRAQMSALGLWGVPSFRVNDTAVWGQDRLWAVEQAILAEHPPCA